MIEILKIHLTKKKFQTLKTTKQIKNTNKVNKLAITSTIMRISNTTHDMPDIENNNIMNPPLVDDIELQQQQNKSIFDTSDDATAATTATTDDDEGNKTNRSMKNRKTLVVCGATILTFLIIGACIMMANTVHDLLCVLLLPLLSISIIIAVGIVVVVVTYIVL